MPLDWLLKNLAGLPHHKVMPVIVMPALINFTRRPLKLFVQSLHHEKVIRVTSYAVTSGVSLPWRNVLKLLPTCTKRQQIHYYHCSKMPSTSCSFRLCRLREKMKSVNRMKLSEFVRLMRHEVT